MKKAQGLPITTIVLAIIGLLVLFVLIAFFTGTFSKVGGQAREAAGSTEDVKLNNAQTKCAQWCLQMQGYAADAQKSVSAYCKTTIPLGSGATATDDYCWKAPIYSPCDGAPVGCK